MGGPRLKSWCIESGTGRGEGGEEGRTGGECVCVLGGGGGGEGGEEGGREQEQIGSKQIRFLPSVQCAQLCSVSAQILSAGNAFPFPVCFSQPVRPP